MIVVDASVIAHLVFSGSHTEVVERLHAWDPEWAAPLLCRSELRSVALKHVRAGNVTLESAVASVRATEWVLARREFMVPTDRVLALAERTGCSSYDCEYVALAMELAVPLFTLDRQLLEAFPEIAIRPGES